MNSVQAITLAKTEQRSPKGCDQQQIQVSGMKEVGNHEKEVIPRSDTM